MNLPEGMTVSFDVYLISPSLDVYVVMPTPEYDLFGLEMPDKVMEMFLEPFIDYANGHHSVKDFRLMTAQELTIFRHNEQSEDDPNENSYFRH
jgi:hypothetical protein